MKDIAIGRACGFSILLYSALFVLFALLSVFFKVDPSAMPNDIPLVQCIIYWIVLIPLVLVFSKWYFRKFQPSFKRGLILGIFTLVIFYILDATMLVLSVPNGGGWDLLKTMYTDWKFYIGIVLVLATTSYAGFEFDRTYTFDEKGLTKKSK